jgi:hypothetical protein
MTSRAWVLFEDGHREDIPEGETHLDYVRGTDRAAHRGHFGSVRLFQDPRGLLYHVEVPRWTTAWLHRVQEDLTRSPGAVAVSMVLLGGGRYLRGVSRADFLAAPDLGTLQRAYRVARRTSQNRRQHVVIAMVTGRSVG